MSVSYGYVPARSRVWIRTMHREPHDDEHERTWHRGVTAAIGASIVKEGEDVSYEEATGCGVLMWLVPA